MFKLIYIDRINSICSICSTALIPYFSLFDVTLKINCLKHDLLFEVKKSEIRKWFLVVRGDLVLEWCYHPWVIFLIAFIFLFGNVCRPWTLEDASPVVFYHLLIGFWLGMTSNMWYRMPPRSSTLNIPTLLTYFVKQIRSNAVCTRTSRELFHTNEHFKVLWYHSIIIFIYVVIASFESCRLSFRVSLEMIAHLFVKEKMLRRSWN